MQKNKLVHQLERHEASQALRLTNRAGRQANKMGAGLRSFAALLFVEGKRQYYCRHAAPLENIRMRLAIAILSLTEDVGLVLMQMSEDERMEKFTLN